LPKPHKLHKPKVQLLNLFEEKVKVVDTEISDEANIHDEK
jgi:hypothetical protein